MSGMPLLKKFLENNFTCQINSNQLMIFSDTNLAYWMRFDGVFIVITVIQNGLRGLEIFQAFKIL